MNQPNLNLTRIEATIDRTVKILIERGIPAADALDLTIAYFADKIQNN